MEILGIQKILTAYRSRAKKKNLEFELDFEEFSIILKNPCYYCGTLNLNMVIDRVDNNIGYKINNVVSCCHNCNYGKNNLELSIWVDHLKKLSFYKL